MEDATSGAERHESGWRGALIRVALLPDVRERASTAGHRSLATPSQTRHTAPVEVALRWNRRQG
jgi:hypothetical protein